MQRLHALDGLRAAMMLLGLVLHSAASYLTVSVKSAWPYQDRATSVACDLLVFTIHLFRMPVFFVMAGFFAALLYQREGPRGFLRHRIRRILLPLTVAWPLLCPLVLAGFGFAVARGGAGAGSSAGGMVRAMFAAGLVHLWFLYDLLIFCAAAVVLVPLLGRLPAGLGRGASIVFALLVRRAPGLLALIALTVLTLLPMEQATLETSTAFLPPVRVLVAYGVFFAFGWLLFLNRELVPSFAGKTWPCLAAAVVTACVYLAWGLEPGAGDSRSSHLLGIVLASSAIWLFIFGLTGLFVRHFDGPRSVRRWLADGAYWIYLVHLPFTIWLPGLLAPLAWPALAKFAVVLAATAGATAGSYYLFVRSTWIGLALNGRRFSRGLPPV
jgi:fucose 4-O-acetylase-like acetyltransferase